MTQREFIETVLENGYDYDVLSVICNCFTTEEVESIKNEWDYDLGCLPDYLFHLIQGKLFDIEIFDYDIMDFMDIEDLSFDFKGFSPYFDEYFEGDEDTLNKKDEIFKQIEELFEELNKWK